MKPDFVVVPGDLSYANEPNHGGLTDADQHLMM